ncbi:MAG: efflux RND transporter periplasmic adaptor subunit [Pyrinomonadaceae bacterium]|nr:efflux RND transporter periplasmic adaptor subunit [Pyrinomonadaceae bacterium]MBP6213485.1 efflux RND transporter periplasmic adaptor subunit [Pyrinomonadaceae bacterium]
MSDETNDEMNEGTEMTERRRSNRKPLIIAAASVAVVIVGAAFFWYFRGTSGEGEALPAPRTVSFGDNSSQQSSSTAGDQTITILPDQVEKIGLKIEAVGETLSNEAMSVAATGVVQANAYKETPVISLVGGIIRSVSGELGESVGRGSPVAVIFSDELAASQSRYLALLTDAQTARQNYERTAKLVKLSPVSNTDVDQMLARLKTVQAELVENQKRHERTVNLVKIGAASREELEMATTKLRTSEADNEEAKRRYARVVEVADINPVSRGEFEQAAVRRQTAESELTVARQRLILLGISPSRVNNLRSPSKITSEISLTAPVIGTITKRDVNQGMVVEPNKELMRVTDLSSVWVIAQVYEKDIGLLRTGSGASVTTDAYPGRLFRGQVTYIDPNINPETRTAQVRVELDNPDRAIKLGMYVNVAFGSMGTAERTMPVIPAGAVQDLGGRKVVFIATDKPNVFTVKTVRLGAENNGRFTVLEGLNVGDRVVTEGSFLLRAELLKQDPN